MTTKLEREQHRAAVLDAVPQRPAYGTTQGIRDRVQLDTGICLSVSQVRRHLHALYDDGLVGLRPMPYGGRDEWDRGC